MKTEFEKWQELTARRERIAKGLMLICSVINFVGGYVLTHQGEPVACVIGCVSYVVGFWMFYMAVE